MTLIMSTTSSLDILASFDMRRGHGLPGRRPDVGIDLANLALIELWKARHAVLQQCTVVEHGPQALRLECDAGFAKIGCGRAGRLDVQAMTCGTAHREEHAS